MFVDAAVPSFVAGWVIAMVLGGTSVTWLMWRAGLRQGQICTVVAALVAALLVGSKLLYLLEAWPLWFPDCTALMTKLFSARMRIPGGFVLAIAVAPLSRLIGLRSLWLADINVPAAGLCIVGARIGCFLQGCCFGTPASLPWSVSFPPATEVYRWQIVHGFIWFDAHTTLPVHPLQLYFGIVGLLIFVGLLVYERRKRYDGELLVLFALSYLWSTWCLELLRAEPHDFTRQMVFVSSLAATAVAAAIEWRLRTAPGRAETSTGVTFQQRPTAQGYDRVRS